MSLKDTKYENLTPEQQKKLNSGCLYELMRFVALILSSLIIIYIGALLGYNGLLFLTTVGSYCIARWLVNKLYPNDPLGELREELEKK